jgi:hypothetical protein
MSFQELGICASIPFPKTMEAVDGMQEQYICILLITDYKKINT